MADNLNVAYDAGAEADAKAIASQIRVHEEIRRFISEQRLEAVSEPQAQDRVTRCPLEEHDESVGQSAAEIWYEDSDYFSDDDTSEGDVEIANDPSFAEYDDLKSEDEEVAVVGPVRKRKAEDIESDVECEEVEELIRVQAEETPRIYKRIPNKKSGTRSSVDSDVSSVDAQVDKRLQKSHTFRPSSRRPHEVGLHQNDDDKYTNVNSGTHFVQPSQAFNNDEVDIAGAARVRQALLTDSSSPQVSPDYPQNDFSVLETTNDTEDECVPPRRTYDLIQYSDSPSAYDRAPRQQSIPPQLPIAQSSPAYHRSSEYRFIRAVEANHASSSQAYDYVQHDPTEVTNEERSSSPDLGSSPTPRTRVTYNVPNPVLTPPARNSANSPPPDAYAQDEPRTPERTPRRGREVQPRTPRGRVTQPKPGKQKETELSLDDITALMLPKYETENERQKDMIRIALLQKRILESGGSPLRPEFPITVPDRISKRPYNRAEDEYLDDPVYRCAPAMERAYAQTLPD
ncbi:hypothetical protein DFH11DRAFT_1726072 [Phellopilus nigrolimitatus]|nr:hypothetical protein DFH11DRAFT_1726072 [Phellopilus nigrolimitatus]